MVPSNVIIAFVGINFWFLYLICYACFMASLWLPFSSSEPNIIEYVKSKANIVDCKEDKIYEPFDDPTIIIALLVRATIRMGAPIFFSLLGVIGN